MGAPIPAGEHARSEIRGAVLTALSALGAAVRYYPASDLPAVSVRTSPDLESHIPEADARYRDLTITIEIRRRGAGDLLRDLDRDARIVEEALAADPTLGGRLRDIRYQRTTTTTSVAEEQPAGLLAIEYVALYRVDETYSAFE